MKARSFFSSLASLLCCGAAAAEPLQVGDSIPNMEVLDHTGKTIQLANATKQSLTLIYFFPKADTPG